MGVLKEFASKVFEDDYFLELYSKVEEIELNKFFHFRHKNLTEKEFFDLMRYADILSYSDKAKEKNCSYKIISLLFEEFSSSKLFISLAYAILIRLGNFPALEIISKKCSNIISPDEVEMEKIIKEIFQKDPYGKYIFTDPQFNIYQALKNNNHYSFSGPTSLGKSFIMEAFIKYLIHEHHYCENIVILVPTRALINQVTLKMKSELKDVKEYRVLSHPVIPKLHTNSNTKYLFVFTPERLISYLANVNNPKIDYMFIDEAHKMVSNNDSRGPLFYHAILQAERKSVKLFFSSPNVPNTEVFLQIFEKSTEETMSIKESPVAQSRYFLDLYNNKITLFSDFNKDVEIQLSSINENEKNFNFWLNKLGKNSKNIVYCNSTKDTIEYAIRFSRVLPIKKNEKINELVQLIKEHIHRDYYLIECLKKGVAYHFGRLPQRVREKIEQLFSERIIDYIFCTSTLLEGVNLPAKNIFILSNAIGLSKFKDIDFWNLAGRAGRLSKELSGNIICTKIVDKRNSWGNLEKDIQIIKNKDVKKIQPLVIKGQKNFFENIARSLENREFTRKNVSSGEIEIWNHYANIALIHELRDDQSVLKSNFITKIQNGKEILKKKTKENYVPANILTVSSTIKETYQNRIWLKDNLITLPTEVTKENCYGFLIQLYDLYNWAEEESKGHAPLAKNINKLKYYAILMKDWMTSVPLNKIIWSIISYYKERGEFWDVDGFIEFTGEEKWVINLIINELMRDIETNIRFKMKNYFTNYYLIMCEKYGEKNAGANWGDYLEYGTTDLKIIELQNIGLPRHLATYILDNHLDCLEFEDGALINIFEDKIIQDLDKNKPEYYEFIQTFGLN
ncbi:superfamily II helicase [Desulfosporosinus orientis DSM 765]|uniref:Superfamily II helicase n=1 Tax=Desulfosporosinus orientis (strain ATCC 19365 / DSM 765 / NCIMB 8382 / VKM B-1628 / Singapore I) TaxID=768706 RepID=G7W5I2_DESOD|nr:DEAD/DEAH box helicase [Desulfosporosinus orientis]AET66629.1 superfamily II helicase [Desulfosporosinus orientis DSM 765]